MVCVNVVVAKNYILKVYASYLFLLKKTDNMMYHFMKKVRLRAIYEEPFV